jgi:hypothetical protein
LFYAVTEQLLEALVVITVLLFLSFDNIFLQLFVGSTESKDSLAAALILTNIH